MNTFEIGAEAEEIALSYEKVRLGKKVSEKFVKLVSGKSSLGYDIESIDSLEKLDPRYIEVKTMNARREIIITDHQVRVLKALQDRAYLYIVNLRSGTVEKIIQNPISGSFEKNSTVHTYNLKI